VRDACGGNDVLDRDAVEAALLEQVEGDGLQALSGGGTASVSG